MTNRAGVLEHPVRERSDSVATDTIRFLQDRQTGGFFDRR
jgi:hypothetical protein